MTATASAIWLDSFFAGYDHFFLMILHAIATKLGVILTPLMKLVTLLGEKGILFFLLALVFMLCADRRDLGVCIFGAVCCGALITNIILKDSVARLRPFEAAAEYRDWWIFLGSPAEDGYSFPSGHVTACTAGLTAITLMRGKKWIWPSVILVLVMGISRNYLMAHYPSDVLFAALIGLFSGAAAWVITQFIFRFLRRRRKQPVFANILSFDIRDVLPFTLPALPLRKGDLKAAFTARRAAPGEKRAPARANAPAEEAPADPDDDVKTYTRAKSAAEPAPAAAPEAAPELPSDDDLTDFLPAEADAPAAEPAADEAPAPSEGRRVRASEAWGRSADAARRGRHFSPAEPKSRFALNLRLPGAGKGKHAK